MVQGLVIPKRFNTYADVFGALGVALVVEEALHRSQQRVDSQLVDRGSGFGLVFNRAIDVAAIAHLPPGNPNPFPPVQGEKTDVAKLPLDLVSAFDVVAQTERRKVYRGYRSQQRLATDRAEEMPEPPDARTQNGAILTSMRHDRNHNDLWLGAWELREYYGLLVAELIRAFSQEPPLSHEAAIAQVVDRLQRAGCAVPPPASAVKVYLPTTVQGVNRAKADTNKVEAQKTDWLSLWLIAAGLFQLGLAERVKVAERGYDWRLVALIPKDIAWQTYQQVWAKLRQVNLPGAGYGVARFDAELILRFCQELLDRHPAKANRGEVAGSMGRRRRGRPLNDFVTGFSGTHFNSKGKVHGVKEVFSLGLPGWIAPVDYAEVVAYQGVVNEHLAVVRSLSVEAGEGELLASYRDFIASGSLRAFFGFQVSYADYVVRQLADPKARPPRLFSVEGLNLMSKADDDFLKIVQDPSFLRVAKAINQSTVYAGKVRTAEGQVIELDWLRQYGLAQRLSTQSGSKTEFLSAIADFLARYEAENLRIAEQLQREGKTLRRVWPTKADLDGLVRLVSEHDHGLVANLLIAYGYARWTKAREGDLEDAIAVEEAEDGGE